VSREQVGGNVVVPMPRGLRERLGEEPTSALSERETEAVVLAARGFSNRPHRKGAVRRRDHRQAPPGKRHLANAYEKIGVHSRSEAVRMALTEQWIGIGEITRAATGTAPTAASFTRMRERLGFSEPWAEVLGSSPQKGLLGAPVYGFPDVPSR
jgi:DNA-binding CsgD family transcriptional regulator